MFLFLYPAVNVLAPYVSENQKQNGMFSFFVVCHFCRPAFYLPHAYNDNAEKQQSCRQGCFHVLWNNHASPHWIPPLVLLLCWGTWKFLFFCFLKKNARSVTHNFVTKREDEEGSGINLKASCRSESCKNYIGAFSSTNMDTACWSMATSTSAWVIIMSYVQATGCWAAMIFITTKTPWHHTDMYTWEGGVFLHQNTTCTVGSWKQKMKWNNMEIKNGLLRSSLSQGLQISTAKVWHRINWQPVYTCNVSHVLAFGFKARFTRLPMSPRLSYVCFCLPVFEKKTVWFVVCFFIPWVLACPRLYVF